MEKKINYYVIGGQYEAYCYGGTETLHAAKILATKHREHWDNWQGWHTPDIYRAEDTHPMTNFYGEQRDRNDYAQPVAIWDASHNKWIVNED